MTVPEGLPSASPVWRGQLFLFDKPPSADLSTRQRYILLAAFVAVECIARPILKNFSPLTERPWWSLLLMTSLTGLTLIVATRIAAVRFDQLGLRSFRKWSAVEKHYFVQIVPITLAVFVFVTFRELAALWARHDILRIAVWVFIPQVIWGFYQELPRY